MLERILTRNDIANLRDTPAFIKFLDDLKVQLVNIREEMDTVKPEHLLLYQGRISAIKGIITLLGEVYEQ